MELQKEITKLQEEYHKIILEVNKLQELSKIKEANLEEKEYEFDKEKNRLFNINLDIDSNIETNQKHKERYIKKTSERLEKTIVGIVFLLFIIIGITFCLTYAKNTEIIFKLSAMIAFPLIGQTLGLYINDLLKNKYKTKLENKYLESDQNKEYQSQLKKFKQRKVTIEKEHQTKYQIYKNAKDEYNDTLNQINIKKEELHQIKEKLILLVFPNNLFEEVQNLTNTNSFEDNTKNEDIVEIQKQSKTKILQI